MCERSSMLDAEQTFLVQAANAWRSSTMFQQTPLSTNKMKGIFSLLDMVSEKVLCDMNSLFLIIINIEKFKIDRFVSFFESKTIAIVVVWPSITWCEMVFLLPNLNTDWKSGVRPPEHLWRFPRALFVPRWNYPLSHFFIFKLFQN